MLRNPAYVGRAVFGKTQIIHAQPGLNRIARLQGRTTPRPVKTVDRPREEWTQIAVPAIVDEDTFARMRQRLEDNKKFATRGAKVPSLGGLVDHLTGPGGHDRGAEHPPAAGVPDHRARPGDDLDEAFGAPGGDGPVELAHRQAGHPGAGVRHRLLFGQADLGDLGAVNITHGIAVVVNRPGRDHR